MLELSSSRSESVFFPFFFFKKQSLCTFQSISYVLCTHKPCTLLTLIMKYSSHLLFLNPHKAKYKICLLKVKDERCASKCLRVCVVLASCVSWYSWCFSRWLKKLTLSWKCRKTRVKCVPLPRTKISNNKNKACFLCYFHGWGFIFHVSYSLSLKIARCRRMSILVPKGNPDTAGHKPRKQIISWVLSFYVDTEEKRDLGPSWEEGDELELHCLFPSFFSSVIKINIFIGSSKIMICNL